MYRYISHYVSPFENLPSDTKPAATHRERMSEDAWLSLLNRKLPAMMQILEPWVITRRPVSRHEIIEIICDLRWAACSPFSEPLRPYDLLVPNPYGPG